jgi:hypothetical protein
MMGISFGGCGITDKRFGVVVFFLAVSMLTLNSGNVLAQTGGTGIVVGTVTDPSGAAVPEATVTLTDTSTLKINSGQKGVVLVGASRRHCPSRPKDRRTG